jgi:Bifunctional DNA primase/polymerase, N-terminal
MRKTAQPSYNFFARIDPETDDPRHRGDAALVELQRRHGNLPVTWQATTGGGGAHYYFRSDAEIRNSAGKIGQGIDIRGLGGYVVAPPRRHVSGRSYAWDRGPTDVALAAMPAWLADALRRTRLPFLADGSGDRDSGIAGALRRKGVTAQAYAVHSSG